MSIDTIPACTISLTVDALSAWHDGALDQEDTRRVESHIPQCLACRQRLMEYDVAAAALRSIPVPPPLGGYGRNPRTLRPAARLRNTNRLLTSRGLSPRMAGGIGALAAVLMITLAFAVVFGRLSGHPSIVATSTAAAHPTATASATATSEPAPTFTKFSVPSFSQVTDLVNGPDGNLWFAEGPTGDNIGRITPQGQITEFPIPTPDTWTQVLIRGPDGNLWFTELKAGKIGRVTPHGVMSEFPVPSGGRSMGSLVAGSDGNVWFLDGGSIGRITPSGAVTEFSIGGSAQANSLAVGPSCCPDGSIWFTDVGNNAVGRVTVTGDAKEYPLPVGESAPSDIAVGPDNNLWFMDSKLPGKVARVTSEGKITEFALPRASSVGNNMVLGPDGNLWFIETVFLNGGSSTASYLARVTPSGNIRDFPIPGDARGNLVLGPDGQFWFADAVGIARMTTSGDFAEFAVQDANSGLGNLSVGPDGNLWFSEPVLNVIMRATL